MNEWSNERVLYHSVCLQFSSNFTFFVFGHTQLLHLSLVYVVWLSVCVSLCSFADKAKDKISLKLSRI